MASSKKSITENKHFYIIGVVFVLLAFVGIAVAEIAFVRQSNNDSNRTVDDVSSEQSQGQNLITEKRLELYAKESNQTALELLQANAQVEYDEYSFGVFVTTINNLKADNSHYWAFYVNGEYAMQSVDATKLQEGDKVSFVYEVLDQSAGN